MAVIVVYIISITEYLVSSTAGTRAGEQATTLFTLLYNSSQHVWYILINPKSGATMRRRISHWANTVPNQTVWQRRVLTLIIYRIDFIPCIKAQQQQLHGIHVAVPGR